MLTYDDLINRYTAWAEASDDVRAALILGSRTHIDHPADEWSDLDILTFITRCGAPRICAAASCGGPRAAWMGI
jgi:hypothetical protein